MSQDRAPQAAWIAVADPDALPAAVTDEIGDVARRVGFLPNVALLLGVSPSHFVAWWRYLDELLRGPSGLTKTQREMIAVVVSADADCPYCTIAHAAGLRLRTKDPAFVDRLALNHRLVDLDERDRVLLDFAVKLARTPSACGEDDIAALRAAGYGDEDILHAIEVTALFALNVRLATATGLVPNPEYHELGRGAA